MDLEWDFVDEITKYTITVATEDSINTTVMVQNNKATLSNLIPDVQYRISLSTTVGKENTVKGVQFVTLPSMFPEKFQIFRWNFPNKKVK